jgi:WD40 repeat protein
MAGLEAQTAEEPRPAGGHRGKINALAHDRSGRIISAGEDGFIGIWDIQEGRAEERFQISEYALLSLAAHPERNEVAAIESDRMGLYRVSVWDYIQKRNLFTLRFSDPLLFINYSASGSFLIVSRSARSAVVFIQSGTGELLQSPQDLAVTVSLAATGRSERTMITYSSAGTLS